MAVVLETAAIGYQLALGMHDYRRQVTELPLNAANIVLRACTLECGGVRRRALLVRDSSVHESGVVIARTRSGI